MTLTLDAVQMVAPQTRRLDELSSVSPSAASAGRAGQPFKLFVGGLSSQTTTEALRIHFQKYGRLVDAVVMLKNGRPRGFGFITFDSPAGAVAALAEPQWLDGRFVDVKRAVPGEHAQERPSNKIFVGGLPQDASTEDLRACFASYGPVADAVVMVDRRTKRSRGFGFVRFANGIQGSAAADAVLMDAASHRLGGKWIEVKRATPAALLRDDSPCSSGDASTTCTPTSLTLAEQHQQACMYYDCLAAAWEMGLATPSAAGLDGSLAAPGAIGQTRGGRRGRRGRRQSSGGGTSEEFGDELEGSLFGGAAGLWVASGLDMSGGAVDWASSAADMSSMLSPWGSFDISALDASVCSGADTSVSDSPFAVGSPQKGRSRVSSVATTASGSENTSGLANGAAPISPPPGLGMDLSPMKVSFRKANSFGSQSDDEEEEEEERLENFTREDFLSMEVRPWLSAW